LFCLAHSIRLFNQSPKYSFLFNPSLQKMNESS
jgi:hypothetical protein